MSTRRLPDCLTRCSALLFFKQRAAYELRISDWSSDVCSSDLYRMGSVRLTRGCWVGAAAGALSLCGDGVPSRDHRSSSELRLSFNVSFAACGRQTHH